MSARPIVAERTGLTTGRVLHQVRVGAFYGLSGLLTLFLSFELFAHLLLPTPVLTNWTGGHHVHAVFHFVLTAVLLGAVGSGVHPRTRRIAGLQALLLVPALGLLVSVIAWQGIHNFTFPVFNFALYGVIAVVLAALHPERRRLFTTGVIEPRLLAMAVLVWVPLLAYGVGQVAQQLSNSEPVHAAPGHFALSAALAVGLAGLADWPRSGRTAGVCPSGLPGSGWSPSASAPPLCRPRPRASDWLVGSQRSPGVRPSSGPATDPGQVGNISSGRREPKPPVFVPN